MLIAVLTGKVNIIAWTRLCMWAQTDDANNELVMLLNAMMVANFSLLKFLAYHMEDSTIGAISLLLENLVIGVAIMRGLVHNHAHGWTVLTLGAVCFAYMLM
jgi:hypothetical protein